MNAHCIAVMLTWFIDTDVVENALKHNLPVEEHRIERMPENVLQACRDEHVDIHQTRHYFRKDARRIVDNVVRTKREIEEP